MVDDNHLIRKLLGLILESAGFEVVEAESGEDALAIASDGPPDLWLVDDAMPAMAGSELVRRARRSRDHRVSGAPMVGISARPGASSDLLAAGCDTFVPKPVDERRILAAIRRAMRTRRGRQAKRAPAA